MDDLIKEYIEQNGYIKDIEITNYSVDGHLLTVHYKSKYYPSEQENISLWDFLFFLKNNDLI